jgi:plastocyanin
VGDTVVWVNEDMVPHTVTGAGNGGPASGELGAQAEFRWVAGAAGRVAYRCAYHPVMVGEVMVD